MKKLLVVILIIFSACKSIEDSANDVKTNKSEDINSIKNYMLFNKPIDLIKFKKSTENNSYYFALKSKTVCFKFVYFNQDLNLNYIEFYHNSFNKTIFTAKQQDTLSFKFTQTPRMEVFSSIDKENIYFCLHDDSKLFIWSLVNGNTVEFIEVKP